MIAANGERRVAPGAELALVVVLAWLAFVSVPAWFSVLGISWDALNHHIYLGWTADHPRFGQDFLAAGYQSLQFPYLYWPVYKLAAAGVGPLAAGIALATLHLVAVPPVWMIARTCLPGSTWYEAAMRLLAVALAFLSSVVISEFDSTSNDLLAAAPLLWAMAFAIEPLRPESRWPASRLLVLSGLLAGASVACKLSNGPIAILLPLLWFFADRDKSHRVQHVALACACTLVGAVLVYGWWGEQLWTHYGNPLYPFYDGLFEPVRHATGWRPA